LRTASFLIACLVLALASLPQAQGTPPANPLTLISRDGRRSVPTTIVNGRELIALDDVATLFQVTVREDTLAGGITVGYKGRTIIISPDQPMASDNGRIISLPAPAMRAGRRWLVPVEFLSRALAPIYDTKIELRRPSRLLLVGDVRVPRLTLRVDSAGAPTRATVEITPATPVTAAVEAGRITLRLDANAIDAGLPAAGGGLIDSMRAGDQPAVVVLALSPRAVSARATASVADNVTRVAIEVSAATQTEIVPPVAPLPAPAVPAPAAGGATTPTIVIDPGHGGDDTGVKSASGTLERDITLDLARRLKTLLETRLGVRVLMTREDDRAVSLDERTAIANNNKAELFVSLHANASLSPAVSGAEVFTLKLDADADAARKAAASDDLRLPVLGGGTRPLAALRWDLAQASHTEDSGIFASMLEEELRKRVPMGPRPLQRNAMRVLAAANMPAALVEVAYLTNPAQDKALRSGDFPGMAAQSLFDAITRMRTYIAERSRE
jgi:N-acetylmuramoyl-L-alanine amidase